LSGTYVLFKLNLKCTYVPDNISSFQLRKKGNLMLLTLYERNIVHRVAYV